MLLHDANRPKIAHHLAFASGMVVIPKPQIWPIESPDKDKGDLSVEISMMLPIKELSGFMAKWFHATMPAKELPNWLMGFHNNPEQCILETFTSEGEFTPNLDAKQSYKEPQRKILSPSLLDDL